MSQTHELTIDGEALVKRYTSWERGEPGREWTVLSALAAAAPDLVPRPIACGVDDVPPWVSMTRVPGRALSGTLSPAQLDALEVALRRMWQVPVPVEVAARSFAPVAAWEVIGSRFGSAVRPAGLAGDAFDAAVEFLSVPLSPPSVAAVIGHGDPNVANYLWDGVRVRIVDFEDAGVSDVAYELATLVEHLSAREVDADGFCVRFADLTGDGVWLRRARVVWAAFWLHMLLPGGPAARRNPPGTLEVQAARLLSLV
ncbi:MAG: aminoglycoside phosphotransferase family protein [Hamadaea sp.]|nr:aminoglycoside phosphotransferase family protein [Hamadaea sp.]